MEVLGNDELVILIYFLLYYILSFFFLLEYLDFIGFFFGDFVYGLVRILFLNKINKIFNCLFDWKVVRVFMRYCF